MHALLLGLLLMINPAHSKAQFSVSHVFVEHVTGTIAVVSGTIETRAGSLIPTCVTATLDASKVKTDDPDRDVALRGPDFFDVAKYPTWQFTSTNITPSGAGFTMQGALTIHGVTQPETLTVTIGGSPDHPTYHAATTIDRHAFGMARSRLDGVIGNPVDITIDIVTT